MQRVRTQQSLAEKRLLAKSKLKQNLTWITFLNFPLPIASWVMKSISIQFPNHNDMQSIFKPHMY